MRPALASPLLAPALGPRARCVGQHSHVAPPASQGHQAAEQLSQLPAHPYMAALLLLALYFVHLSVNHSRHGVHLTILAPVWGVLAAACHLCGCLDTSRPLALCREVVFALLLDEWYVGMLIWLEKHCCNAAAMLLHCKAHNWSCFLLVRPLATSCSL